MIENIGYNSKPDYVRRREFALWYGLEFKYFYEKFW